MEISLKAEPVAHIGTFPVTNTLVSAMLLSIVLIILAWRVKKSGYSLKSGFYNGVEAIVEILYDMTRGMFGESESTARKVLPLVATFFLFILLSNWMGILPFVGSVGFTTMHEGKEAFVPLFRSTYSDLNMTLALAIISVFMTQIFGFQALGLGYLKKYFNFTSPILAGVGLLEIISEIVKIFSFSFRLFGNIFAGEVLMIVISGLVPYVGPIPFMGIEAFAGAIQALIFTMLSLVFMSGAIVAHGDHDDAHVHGEPSPVH